VQAADVIVFLADLNAHFLFEESMQYLHPSTLAALDQITHPLRRKQIIASRIILKKILSRYMGQAVSLYEDEQTGLLVIDKNTSGDTQVRHEANSSYFWSISHTAHYIGIAISRGPIGFDMERVDGRRRFVDIARFVFHSDESQIIEQASHSDDIAEIFFEIWTLREAVYKMTRWGPFERTIPVKTYLQNHQFFFCTKLIENNLIYSITSECSSLHEVRMVWLSSLP